MSGLRSGLAAVVLLGWCGAQARAQGFVPGGWAMEFGYQPLAAAGNGGFGFGYGNGNSASFGYGYGVPGFGVSGAPVGYGGFSPYGMGGFNQGSSAYGGGLGQPTYPGALYQYRGVPQTFNGTDALIGAIRQSTKTRSRGR